MTSCGDIGKKPFSLKVAAFNEQGPQQAAVITISDPQIFKRETLINDRLRERQLITSLLDESAKPDFAKNFQPQLARDLVNYQAFAAHLKVAVDPSKGAAARRQERLNDINQEIEETKLRTDLEKSKRKLKEAEDANTETSSIQDTDADKSQKSPTAPGLPTLDDIDKRLKAGEQRAKDLLAELDRRAGDGNVRRTEVISTPQEKFRDLSAYRAELRQALAAVDLDDLHDLDGNALYRLQFRASVMPGQYKDKFGVARLTVLPPRMELAEVRELYFSWLNHLTHRMNTRLPIGRQRRTDRRYARLEAAGLFELSTITLCPDKSNENKGAAEDDKCTNVAIALPALSDKEKTSGKNFTVEQVDRELFPVSGAFLAAALRSLDDGGRFDLDGQDMLENAEKNVIKATDAAGGNPAGFSTYSPPKIFADALLRGGPKADKTNTSASFGWIKQDAKDNRNQAIFQMKEAEPAKYNTFDGREPIIARGKAYTYTTQPLELAQRLSTVARSSNSMEVAVALAGTFPSAGLNAEAKAGLIRAAAGNVEALERAPLVVGFADRRSPLEREVSAKDPTYISENQAPQFGWAFGPGVRINAEENTLELIHKVANHEVSADVSVPGWWPRVRVEMETAWVGNWQDTGKIIRLGDEAGQGYHQEWFTVPLPRNSADFDGLTNILAKATIGSFVEVLQIHHVEPYYINACAEEATVLIGGANVWRSAEVHLAGTPAKTVRVLPNMEGIAATFKMDDLYKSKNASVAAAGVSQQVPLVVWTRNGSDTVNMGVEGVRIPGRPASCHSIRQLAFKGNPWNFHITDVSPNRIPACASSAEFLIRVDGFKDSIGNPTFTLNGVVSQNVKPIGGHKKVYSVRFDQAAFASAKHLGGVNLSATNGRQISSAAIGLTSCKAKASNAAAPELQVAATRLIGDGTKLSIPLRLVGGKIPAGKVRLAMLPIDASADSKWIESVGRPIPDAADKTKYSAVIDRGNKLKDYFVAGRPLKFALRIGDASASQDVNTYPVSGNPVYYPNENSAKLSVEGDKSLKGLPATIAYELPKNIAAAYPALAKAKFKATFVKNAKVPALTQIGLKASPEKPITSASGALNVTLEFLKPGGASAFKAIRDDDTTGKEALTLKVSLEGSGDLPALDEDFTIPKAK